MTRTSFPPTVRVIRHPRSPYYWAYWRWKGVSRYATLRTSDKEEALRRAKLLQQQLLEEFYGRGGQAAPPPPPTVADVLQTYRRRLVEPRVSAHHASVQGKRLDYWSRILGPDTPAGEVTTPVLDTWLTESLKALSKTTVRNYLIALRAAYKQAVEDGLLPNIPWKVKAPRARQKTEVVDLAKIRDALGKADLATPEGRALWLAAYTGLRRGDIAALTWEAITQDGVVEWLTSKRERPVGIPMPKRAWEALRGHRGKGRVVPLHVDAITRAMPYGTHAMRHAYATYLAKEGVDRLLVSRLLGHAQDQDVTGGYIHLSTEDLRKTVEKLPY